MVRQIELHFNCIISFNRNAVITQYFYLEKSLKFSANQKWAIIRLVVVTQMVWCLCV